MIYELANQHYDRARALFAGLENRVAIQAIIEGNSPGRIFVDDPEQPASAFTWNPFRYGYLVGESDNGAFNASLRQLLASELLPQAAHSHDPTLVLYPHPADWQRQVTFLLGDYAPIALTRQTFRFNPARFQHHDWPAHVPAGLRLQSIDADLIKQSEQIAGALELLWCSTSAFLSKGLGFCLLDGEQILSMCFSPFVGGSLREIGVDTQPDYRRRGYATLTAAAFISQCLQNGLTPVWECWADNAPSLNLAEKLGFEAVAAYPVYFIELPSDH